MDLNGFPPLGIPVYALECLREVGNLHVRRRMIGIIQIGCILDRKDTLMTPHALNRLFESADRELSPPKPSHCQRNGRRL